MLDDDELAALTGSEVHRRVWSWGRSRREEQLDPVDTARLHYTLGVLAYQGGIADVAEVLFRRADELHPGDGRVQFALARCVHGRGELGQSLEHYVKAMDAGVDTRQALGEVLVGLGREDDALQLFRTIYREMARFNTLQRASDTHGAERYLLPDEAMHCYYDPLFEVIGSGRSVLDIGCNNGSTLDYLRRRGCSALGGLEISESALSYFREHFPETWSQTRIWSGSLLDRIYEVPDSSFDVVHTRSTLSAALSFAHLELFAELTRVSRRWIFHSEKQRHDHCTPNWSDWHHDYRAIYNALGWKLIYEGNPHPEKETLHAYTMVFIFERPDHAG